MANNELFQSYIYDLFPVLLISFAMCILWKTDYNDTAHMNMYKRIFRLCPYSPFADCKLLFHKEAR